ncbi:MAG: hypothetical protein NVS9B14_03050 [Candidatus Acidiferrum sp.]
MPVGLAWTAAYNESRRPGRVKAFAALDIVTKVSVFERGGLFKWGHPSAFYIFRSVAIVERNARVGEGMKHSRRAISARKMAEVRNECGCVQVGGDVIG